jgi:hypothetical protein
LFKDTPAGQQIIDVANARGVEGSDKDKVLKFLEIEAPTYAKERVTSTFAGSGTDDITINPWVTPSDNTTSVQVGDVESIGKLIDPDATPVDFQPAPVASGFGISPISKATENVEATNTANKRRLDEIRTKYGESLPEGITDENLTDIYNSAINASNNQSLGIKYIPEPEVNDKIRREILASGPLARNFYVYDGRGSTSSGKIEDVTKELGLKTEEDVMSAIGTSGGFFFTQDGPEAGMYGVRVTDKDGNSRNLLIGSNSNIQAMTSISNTINKKVRTLDDTPVVDEAGGAYRVKFTLNPETKVFDYVVEDGYMNNKGEFVKQGDDISLNAIKMQELNNLVDSPIIGTSFNFNTLPKLAQPTQSLFN